MSVYTFIGSLITILKSACMSSAGVAVSSNKKQELQIENIIFTSEALDTGIHMIFGFQTTFRRLFCVFVFVFQRLEV